MGTTQCIIVLIAVWSLIQGFAYGILSILALLAHDCKISMRQSKVSYLMYIIFFRDQKCESIDWTFVADIPPPYEPVWPAITHVAYRTNIIALVYLLLNAIWIITSLMLIVGCCLACMGRVTYYLLILPWAIVCTLVSISDVVAVGFFFYDLFNTLNTESFVHHLNMQIASSEFASLLISTNILPMPAVIMIIVASRGFIFWCFNILSIPVVLSHAKKMLFGGGKGTPDSSEERDFEYTRNHTRSNDNILENHFPATAHSRYSDPSHYHQYDNMSYQQDKYDLNHTIGRRYVEPLKDQTIDATDNRHHKRLAISRQSSNDDKLSKKSSWSDDSGHSASTAHLTQSNITMNPKQINPKSYNWRDMSNDPVLKIERPNFRMPHEPSLLKKLSDSSYVMPDRHHHPTVQYSNKELRSQMPWSYFGTRSDVIKPKKTFNELRDDEVLPPVPVPDYMIHNYPKDRPVNSAGGYAMPVKKVIKPRSQWSGPELRY